MTYHSLLVHMDRSQRTALRLELAFSLAERFGAHVTGLFAVSHAPVPASIRAEVPAILAGLVTEHHQAAADAARQQLETLARRHPSVVAEARSAESHPADAVVQQARYADLVILGQHQSDAALDTGVDASFVDDVVLKAGKPVLVIPYAGDCRAIGERVLVAWNAAPQAVRALDYALPLLERAKEVHVAVFGDPEKGDHGEEPGADIALYLARHNARVSVSSSRQDTEIGAQILNRAADLGADLIVMGAYSRSPARERLFGGATRTLMQSMTAPVLMAH